MDLRILIHTLKQKQLEERPMPMGKYRLKKLHCEIKQPGKPNGNGSNSGIVS